MASLQWDLSERPYYAGVDHGVLYLPGQSGIPWNGLVSVNEVVSGSNNKLVYIDGIPFGLVRESEDFSLSVAAYTYPNEFSKFTGFEDNIGKFPRRYFGMSYRTGDTLTGQIHLVYNAMAVPSDRSWQSLTAVTSMSLFKWNFSTKPDSIPGIRPTAHVAIDLVTAPAAAVNALMSTLYGSSTTNPTLPDLAGVLDIFEDNAVFQVTDNGDGTWTARGVTSAVQMLDSVTAQISWPTVVAIDSNIYQMSTDY